MTKEDQQREKYPYKHLPDHRLYYGLDGKLIQGVFDDQKYETRDEYDYGVQIHRITRMWVENQQSNNRLPDHLRVQWGTFPQLPERLKK